MQGVADRSYLDMQDILHKYTSQLRPNSICHQFDLSLHSWRSCHVWTLEHLIIKHLCRNCLAGWTAPDVYTIIVPLWRVAH